MKNISKSELAAILTRSRQSRIKFALEIENINEGESCIFKFEKAFSSNLCKNPMEFMAVFVDSNSEEHDAELNISVNALYPEFSEECAGKIREITNSVRMSEIKITFHADNMAGYPIINNLDRFNLPVGELVHSLYYDADINSKNIETYTGVPENLTMRMLDTNDKILCGIFEADTEDNYFATLFDYTIICPKYKDCGIIGGFNANGKIIGYLSYYGLDECIRDVSYIYVGKDHRRKKYGEAMLNFFKNKNINEKKISYYSYPENKYSEKLAEACGFIPCAYRYEYTVQIK